MSRLSEKINDLFAQEKWPEARAQIEKEVAKRGEADHWLLTRLSTTYYEERQYKKALQLLEQARPLAPECPLVLWDYAGTLDALGRSKEAIEVYLDLIQRDAKRIAVEECGEGLAWAIGLLTDCFYRISVCLKHLHRPQEALRFLGWYAGLVDTGAQSIYAEDQDQVVKHKLEVLREQTGTSPSRSVLKRLKEFSKEAERLLHAA